MGEKNLIKALLKQETQELHSAGTHLMSPCREEQEKALLTILLVRETVSGLLKKLPGKKAKQIWEGVNYLDGVYVQGMISAHRSRGDTDPAFEMLSSYASIVSLMNRAVNENARKLPDYSVRKLRQTRVQKEIDENDVFCEDLLNNISEILLDIEKMRTQLEEGVHGEENRSKFVIDFLYTKVSLEDIYASLNTHGCFEDKNKHAEIFKCVEKLREEYAYMGDIIHGIIYNGSSLTAKTMVKKLFFLTSAILLSVLEP